MFQYMYRFHHNNVHHNNFNKKSNIQLCLLYCTKNMIMQMVTKIGHIINIKKICTEIGYND